MAASARFVVVTAPGPGPESASLAAAAPAAGAADGRRSGPEGLALCGRGVESGWDVEVVAEGFRVGLGAPVDDGDR